VGDWHGWTPPPVTQTSEQLAVPHVESSSEQPKDLAAVHRYVRLSHILYAMGLPDVPPEEIVVRLQGRIRTRLAVTRRKLLAEKKAAKAAKLAAEKAAAEAQEKAEARARDQAEARAKVQEGAPYFLSPPRPPLAKPVSPGFTQDSKRSYAGAWDARRAREAELYAMGMASSADTSPMPLFTGDQKSSMEGGLGRCVYACLRSIVRPGRPDSPKAQD